MPSNENSFIVYVLMDGSRIRYVGITSKGINERLRGHLKDKSVCHRTSWISMMKEKNKPITYAILSRGLSKEEACRQEIEFIAKAKINGLDLVNQTLGGEAVMKGRKHKQETKDRMSETRKKEGNSFYGKKHTEESRKKMSDSLTGRRSWNIGKHLSDEHKRRLSESHKSGCQWRVGRTRFDLEKIRKMHKDGISRMDLARIFQTDHGTISNILLFRRSYKILTA